MSKSGSTGTCPKSERIGITDEEKVEEMMKRMDVNDAGAIYALGNWYYHGDLGLLPDREKARELLTRSADLLLGQHL